MCCLWFVACSVLLCHLLGDMWCSLIVACCWLCVICCVMCVGCRSLFAVRCLLFVGFAFVGVDYAAASCMLCVVCGVLLFVCCVLFAVC